MIAETWSLTNGDWYDFWLMSHVGKWIFVNELNI
jgi:hypothetical protein